MGGSCRMSDVNSSKRTQQMHCWCTCLHKVQWIISIPTFLNYLIINNYNNYLVGWTNGWLFVFFSFPYQLPTSKLPTAKVFVLLLTPYYILSKHAGTSAAPCGIQDLQPVLAPPPTGCGEISFAWNHVSERPLCVNATTSRRDDDVKGLFANGQWSSPTESCRQIGWQQLLIQS